MKTKFFSILAIMVLFTMPSLQTNSYGQEAYKDGFLKRFGVAAKIGTYGPGFDLHTSLTPNLKARLGFNYLQYTYKQTLDFYADGVNGGSVDGQFNSLKFNFPNVNLLLDFYPVKSGIFCFTAGAYLGSNKIKTTGTAEGPFVWSDIEIHPDNTGYFDADLTLGNTVKPYFGIGLGRTISKSRVGFRFDLGLIYQGDYTISSAYSPSAAYNATQGMKDELELPVSNEVLGLWPVISFSLSYRIK